MTQREKTLAGVLVGLLVVAGGGLGGYMFVYRPLTDVNSRLRAAEGQLNKKEQELSAEEQQNETILRLNPRLQQWAKLSLPPRDPTAKKVSLALQEEAKKKHLNYLQVEYEAYLYRLLTDSGLTNVKIFPRPIERRAGQGFSGKQPVYEQLSFGAEGRGTMTNVSKALREFHKTPLLHKVRNLTLNTVTTGQNGGGAAPGGRRGGPGGPGGFGGFGGFGGRPGAGASATSDGTLDMKLTVEALMMSGGEERVGLLPSKLAYAPKVLALPERDYSVLDKRNMFTGFSLRSTERPTDRPSGPKEERHDVLRFVKLTMLFFNPMTDRWEATLYDQAKGGAEKRLSQSRARREFAIEDRYKNPILEAKVVLVDDQQLVFQEGKKYYRLYCGDMVYPAIMTPLRRAELDELGIEPEEEEEKEKEKKKVDKEDEG